MKLLIKLLLKKISLSQYVIKSLLNNKLILYGCDSIREIKQKLIIFENIDKTFHPHHDFSRRFFGPATSGHAPAPSVNKNTLPNE